MEAAKKVKVEGLENDLLDRIIADNKIDISKEEVEQLLDVNKFIGRAPQQVEEFFEQDIKPILEKHKDVLGQTGDVRV